MNLLTRGSRQPKGSTLIVTVVLMGVATVTVITMLTTGISFSRQAESNDAREKAAFLADAGLSAALVRLNTVGEGNITFADSHDYFHGAHHYDGYNWGFQTQVTVISGRNYVVSYGTFDNRTVDVKTEITLGAGSRSIHALYAHALFAGNSSSDSGYTLEVGGTYSGADFVKGDTYSGGDIDLSGHSELRLPELLNDIDGDGLYDPYTDTWVNAYAVQTFTNPLSQAAFDAYVASMEPYMDKVYNNGRFDIGEAYVDTIGNGVYDEGEPFSDDNANGVRDPGDEFTDLNGNGVWDYGEPFEDMGNGVYDNGEEWTDDPAHAERQNGRYDPAGGYWERHQWWRWTWWTWETPAYAADWPPEEFEDIGDGIYEHGEDFVDQNGIYDEGEQYLDDRNGLYDYGTQAAGSISGMPSPGPGQRAATGSDPRISAPDLVHMYYGLHRTSPKPGDALDRWGHDIAVTAADYGSRKAINDSSQPEHIFVRNPPRSGNDYVWSDGAKIYKRTYDYVYDNDGSRVDDYFLEDPTDPSFNTYISEDSIDGTVYTAPMYINVRPEHNIMLYYVEGNLYIHHPRVYSMRFRQPDTRITIVAKGNITISDEFYYKADYDDDLERSDMDSTIVNHPEDALCLIALKDPNCSDSGNIYIGDKQFGTGGSIHAMLYAEEDFVDNNLNTSDQQFISVFGNMSAGDHLRINREEGGGHYRTRLDVTLDERIRDGAIIVPGLPHPEGGQRSIQLDTAWHSVPGSWSSWSLLE